MVDPITYCKSYWNSLHDDHRTTENPALDRSICWRRELPFTMSWFRPVGHAVVDATPLGTTQFLRFDSEVHQKLGQRKLHGKLQVELLHF